MFYRLHSASDGRRYACKVCESAYKFHYQQTPAYKAWRHEYQHNHPETWGMEYFWNPPAPSEAEQYALAYE